MLGAPAYRGDLRAFVLGELMSLRRQFSRAAGSVCQSSHRSVRIIVLCATTLSIVGSGAFAADGDANAALMKKLERMERRIRLLESQPIPGIRLSHIGECVEQGFWLEEAEGATVTLMLDGSGWRVGSP